MPEAVALTPTTPIPSKRTSPPASKTCWENTRRIAKIALQVFLAIGLFASTPLSPPLFIVGFVYGVLKADSAHQDIEKLEAIWTAYRWAGMVAMGISMLLAWHWVMPFGAALFTAKIGSDLQRKQPPVKN